ncbi:hypothetical protein [Streptomyces longisporoflavus]|uniref:Uncharacterized protein n=1 Tax=Streptomyces longisporoflavus TaxID=28044 RepID=A0ABW7R4D1_9ACTN
MPHLVRSGERTAEIVHFTGAWFSGGMVDFDDTRFTGGTVDVSGAESMGLAPRQLPPGLSMPEGWLPPTPRSHSGDALRR